ncbi:MAG: hypothetical protein FWC11_00740 [Firmicutes bacterium]|nr:hypothetical protein [Bacillota bacterium]
MTRVFDPLDGECEYKQNPTKQSKTVDNKLSFFLVSKSENQQATISKILATNNLLSN